MTRKNLLMMAVLVALSGAGVAFAEQKAGAGEPGVQHMKIDANGDGVIDKAEAAKFPRLAAKFDTLDANKDGKLSKEERPAHKGHRKGGHARGGDFRGKLDADKDGRISRDEAKTNERFAARFDTADANKDGFLDKADFEQRAKQRRDEFFAKADTNKDGQLSKAEFDAAKPAHRDRGPHGEAKKQ